MADPDELFKNIPDVWFDWYARLIPGSIGIGLYFWFYKISFVRDTKEILLLLFLSYIIGHIISPFSSIITRTCFKSKKLKPLKNRLASKAYSEMISMSNSFIVSLTVLVYAFIFNENIECYKFIILIALLIIFAVGTILRSDAIVEKNKEE